MGNPVYNLFLLLYSCGIKIASLFNSKANLWVSGRKKFPALAHHQPPVIWMHCASLGEFEQGRPVLEELKKQYPNCTIVLSFFSPSGYEGMKNYKGADYIFYLPMDGKTNAKKLIDTIDPALVLWVKYEYWFYYLQQLKSRHIPVLLVSGIFRTSQPFFKWYGKAWRNCLQCFTHFFVQNAQSAELLASLGVDKNITISGDTRVDRVIEIAAQFIPLPIIENFCGNGKVIVAGSTWEDDEAELVHYVNANRGIKFIIAPHEIDKENIQDVKKEFPNAVLYSELEQRHLMQSIEKDPQLREENVLIIDNIGMLSRIYHYAHITYVGGGFGADGVHNVLEAAVHGKPVIYGPEYEKFAEATELVECGAGITIENALELEKVLNELWNDEDLLKAKGDAAKKYVLSKGGATKKLAAYIQENRLLTN